MDHSQHPSGSLPIEDMDDFDPYGESTATESGNQHPRKTTSVSVENVRSQTPESVSGTEPLGLEAQAASSSKDNALLHQSHQEDVEMKSAHGGEADTMEMGHTEETLLHQKSAEVPRPPLQEDKLPSPPPSSAPLQTLPGLDMIGTMRDVETNTPTGIDMKEPASVTMKEPDAESALRASEPVMAEEAAVLPGAEVESDSSPYESSSDDTSSDDSDDSEEDYELLDPVEQARRLMEGDGSDDEGGKTATGGQPRTTNETVEEVVEIPKIDGIAEMRIEELGLVEASVENMILVKAKTSGEYQVLESGSVLCLPDKTLIGVVSETLGRVQEPLYCVRFTNAATITGFGLDRGSMICYVPQHSTFVFTQALQAVKGSDASNIHDEEIGREEIEFSDDEAEAEYKRKKKLEKQERKGLRGDSTRARGDFSRNSNTNHLPSDPSTLSYDDTSIDDGLYTPLTRPATLNGPGQVPPPISQSDGFARGPGGLRGRGQRGHGRGGYRGRGNQSGNRGFQNHSTARPAYSGQDQPMQQAYSPTNNQYSPSQQNGMFAQPQQFQPPSAFQVQGGQYPNHFQYQPNQFPIQQQPQQFAPQGYQQQWPGYNPSASTPNQAPQASAYWNQGTAYPDSAAFYASQYQQQQQHQPPPPPG